MCQSQNTFWKCRHLASGKFHLCTKYSETAGRECEGYTSFARVIQRVCPTCSRRAAARPAPSQSEQASAGAEELTESAKLERERQRRARTWAPNRRTKTGKKSVVNRYLESREALGAGSGASAGADTQAGAEASAKS